jgi:NADPH-dependent 7-cyano-7-deazaguanine reductase QueF
MSIQLTISQLEDLLDQQKVATAEYITRNLTVYKWFEGCTYDIDETKQELKIQCLKSNHPDEFNILKKYIKP